MARNKRTSCAKRWRWLLAWGSYWNLLLGELNAISSRIFYLLCSKHLFLCFNVMLNHLSIEKLPSSLAWSMRTQLRWSFIKTCMTGAIFGLHSWLPWIWQGRRSSLLGILQNFITILCLLRYVHDRQSGAYQWTVSWASLIQCFISKSYVWTMVNTMMYPFAPLPHEASYCWRNAML